MRAVHLVLLGALGCGGAETNGTEPSSEPAEPTAPVPAEPDPRYADAPEGTEAIARLLRARHTEDLPDRDALVAHPEPEASLRWLVTNGDPMLVRVRAASTLRHFDGAETLTLLRSVYVDEAQPGNLRAAAIEGTARFRLDDVLRAELEVAAALDDPRIARAARARLDGPRGTVAP